MIWISAFLLVVFSALVFIMFKHFSRDNSQLINNVNVQLNSMRSELNERLKETTQSVTNTRDVIDRKLEGNTDVIGKLQTSLGKLEAQNEQLSEKMKDISSLQDLLKPPQVRGGIGEVLLENILTQIFGDHKEFYQTQYKFKSGEAVDAIIQAAKDTIICIDAKFPLESFQRMIADTSDEQLKKSSRRDFIVSVRKKIDDIASKYILPDEGTMDFALMYIPSEGIYYEIIKEQKIWDYAILKKVIPVSPNTFYPYLMVILRGLKGLQLEKNVQDVILNLRRLKGDLDRFKEDFKVLGTHIKNTRDKYEKADSRLNRFSDKLDNTQNIKSIETKTKGTLDAQETFKQ